MYKTKSKLWVSGRKDWKHKLEFMSLENKNRAWIHCASLGEFEQARPLIKPLKNEGYSVVVSFFSPSGFEVVSKREDITVVYLPLDTKNNARTFLEILRPDIAIFIRYEFWYHYLSELKRRSVPTFLVSASFRKTQVFFQPIVGKWFRKILMVFSRIFVIDEESESLLKIYHITRVLVNGDTRADRVIKIAKDGFSENEIVRILEGYKSVIVAGSTWKTDEEYLNYVLGKNNETLLILAPHEISTSNLERCCNLFENSILYSEIEKFKDENVLIIDNIGMLSSLYAVADICYVGGGFGTGIHNVLEPAAHQKPVVFGPKFQKFPEAVGLISNSGAYSVSDKEELNEKLTDLLMEKEKRTTMGQSAFQYVMQLSGATQRIMKEILQSRI